MLKEISLATHHYPLIYLCSTGMVGETLHPEESRLDIYIPTRENSGDAGTILVPVPAQKSGVLFYATNNGPSLNLLQVILNFEQGIL